MRRQVSAASVRHETSVPAWDPATRVAFRFCFVYFGLYSLTTQIAGGVFLLPAFYLPALGTAWPMREITIWLAEHLFGVTQPLVYTGNSGDTVFHWVQTAWLLALATLATAIWSALDRGRREYLTLHKWFRLFIRFGLAAQMFYYGMAKVIPAQFPPPSLVTLVEPIGYLSLSDLLWAFVGSSTAYQVFTGCAELAAGLLLIVPRTTTLGALIAVADMFQVFLLNMTYDFGLKQISFHLILMALFLLAPQLRRLTNVLLDRAAGPSTQPPLFVTARANRIALATQIAFGIYLLGMFSSISVRLYYAEGGGGSARSPLYGIWNIDELSIDGETRPSMLNDYNQRWRRLIFDSPDVLVFQRTDDSFARYGVTIDTRAGTLALTKGASRNWKASFTFQRPAEDRLVLEGRMDDRAIHMRLRRVELDTFRLLNSRFRWVRPPDPYAG
jgi:uncharacterized membrane protein YphA (DoxX/SURF4 family)